ncbi:MAG: sigma-70 family RNA polymerase sigma factor [Planctomycetaceae bacterium]|nr:sigma-70 family RNA polymerase sigma factor [Planctomycetales bacterium]MCB9922789.1 sigma-70 family RNA polymerase sigma factor [Planctomycetaceae bacterium]
MNTKHHSQTFNDLRQGILAMTDDVSRLACSRRAEQLLDRIDPKKFYDASVIAGRILGIEDTDSNTVSLSGEEVRSELLQMIDEISAVTIAAADLVSEPVLTVDEVAQRWNVSAKTISRWRNRGLVARTFTFDGRQRVGFLESSLNRFAAANPKLIRRGSLFSRITEEEKTHTLRRADEMLNSGTPISKVVTTLARDTQRSLESIRQLLKQAGKGGSFVRGKLNERAEQRLYKEFRRGKSLGALAQQYGIDVNAAARAMNRARTDRILELPLEYMSSPDFAKSNADERILSETPPATSGQRLPRKPSDLPAYIASLYDVPLLTAEQETHLFRKYNYLKFKASQLREKLNRDRPKSQLLDDIELLYREAVETKNLLTRSNLRLVVAVAKKYVGNTGDLFEKVSEGNLSLMRAVEKFDYTRGFKFSTYATWAIKKNYIRAYSNEVKQTDRFRTGHDELLDASPGHRSDPTSQLAAQRRREDQVSNIMERLTDRERQIISSRFGIGSEREPMTLKDVGVELGVSKERVRQIEARAMQKLREAAVSARLDNLSDSGEFTFQSN